MKTKSLLLTIAATFGMAASTMAQNVPNYVPTNGLVGWWPFNGNANDESGNNNNGTINGATLTTDRFGNAGKAYSFDGNDDYGSIIFNSNLSPSSGTVGLWIKSNGQANSQKFLFGQGFGRPQLVVSNSPHKAKIQWGTNPGVFPGVSSLSDVDNSLWNFVVGVYDSTSFKIYINGILENTFTTSLSQYSCNSDFMIGGANSPASCGAPAYAGQFFNGTIDDIGMWSRNLTQQEITDLYNGNVCYQTITVTDTLLINMGVVSYNPVTYNNTIKIFPNPTNDHITIDYGNFSSLNGYQLKIENSLGQQVFQTNINQQSDYLSLTNWGGNGLYFVRIIDPQGNTIDIRKIVLQ